MAESGEGNLIPQEQTSIEPKKPTANRGGLRRRLLNTIGGITLGASLLTPGATHPYKMLKIFLTDQELLTHFPSLNKVIPQKLSGNLSKLKGTKSLHLTKQKV